MMGQSDRHAPGRVVGGSRELLALAAPLILGNAFVTAQLIADRVLLSRVDPELGAAAFQASMLFWLPFSLLQGTAAYVATFVAQYTGAGRPLRVGPAVWQGLHFSVVMGVLFAGLWFVAPGYIAFGQHTAQMQVLEVTYFRCLVFVAVPALVAATVSGFFSGRSSAWAVLGINAVGTVVNVTLDYLLIAGRFGFPALGIAGAGWATVAGASVSAIVALGLLWRPQFRRRYDTLRGWKPDRDLLGRLLRFGGPAGIQQGADVLAFTLFTVYVGRLGPEAAAATGIAVTLNLFAFLPTVGMGQAVAVLVGQRLGENRPDLAARSANLGVRWAGIFMLGLVVLFVAAPLTLIAPFAPDPATATPEVVAAWPATAALIPILLRLVAIYAMADVASVVYAGALRGAGDTRFVTWVTFSVAVPLMVVPTYLVVSAPDGSWWANLAESLGGRMYVAWAFATVYILSLAVLFWLRFLAGRWRTMRVIESTAPVA